MVGVPQRVLSVAWTRRDQETLDALMERKRLFEQQALTPLADKIASDLMKNKNQPVRALGLAKRMVADADTWRDLLAPFDSGDRPPRAG